MIEIEVTIKGEDFSSEKVLAEIEKTMRKDTAKALKKDFDSTVRTWNEKPKFKDVFTKSPDELVLEVFPDGENADKYKWVDLGTKPRIIIPKPPNTRLKFRSEFTPKTIPGRVGSQAGGQTGSFVYPTKVERHPGIEPREFSETIAKKNTRQFQLDIQFAIERATS